MLDVFLTIDVEIWCDGWEEIDRKFPTAFRKYIHGDTRRGAFGLPYQLDVIAGHGLHSVCFVEPLFSTRFGAAPLEEIVDLVLEREQEIQAHLHTEWVDESHMPLIENNKEKRQYLFQFNLEEQSRLIAAAIELLKHAGASEITAFRAGSFGFNADTLRALAANRIPFDCSYNFNMFGPDSGVSPGVALVEPARREGVCEYPLTVFRDGLGKIRQAQLTSCSWAEMERLLWRALHEKRKAFVILSHNFELLSPSKCSPDDVVIRRLHKLCDFLDRNRDCFRTSGFRNREAHCPIEKQPPLLKTSVATTILRLFEQTYRRRYP